MTVFFQNLIITERYRNFGHGINNSMSFPSVLSPLNALSMTYPDALTIDSMGTLAVQNVVALKTDAGFAQTLLLGATSNIVIESASDAKLYLKNSAGFDIFHSTFDGTGVRTDANIVSVNTGVCPDSTTVTSYINAGANATPLWVYGTDANSTTWISSTQFRTLNHQEQLSTTESDGFILNNQVEFASNVTMDENCYMKSSLQVDGVSTFYGPLFAQNVNMWADDVKGQTDQRVGFGFSINSNSQLELRKYASYADGVQFSKKVAVFGASPMLPTESNDGSYVMFDALAGIGVHSIAPQSTGSGGADVPLNTASSSFVFNQTGNITTTASLGIGVADPLHPVDVLGTVNCTTLQAINLNATNVTTTSDERLKSIVGTVAPADCLAKVAALDVIDFSYIGDLAADKSSTTDTRTGLRAQQVDTIMPDAVITKSFAGLADCKLIDTSVLLAYLVGAVKELSGALPR